MIKEKKKNRVIDVMRFSVANVFFFVVVVFLKLIKMLVYVWLKTVHDITWRGRRGRASSSQSRWHWTTDVCY